LKRFAYVPRTLQETAQRVGGDITLSKALTDPSNGFTAAHEMGLMVRGDCRALRFKLLTWGSVVHHLEALLQRNPEALDDVKALIARIDAQGKDA
jgi:hypothetical protein